jgi:hypothetical protein
MEKAEFPNFTAATVLKFVAVSFTNGWPLGLFRTIMPVLVMVEKVTGREQSVLTDHVKSAVYSVQRYYEQRKPAVKKAKKLDYLVVNHLIELEILPHIRRPHNIEMVHFRSLFRATIIYFMMCRFADFAKLTDCEFTDGGDHIKFTFLTRKNDTHNTDESGLCGMPGKTDQTIFLAVWALLSGFGKECQFPY